MRDEIMAAIAELGAKVDALDAKLDSGFSGLDSKIERLTRETNELRAGVTDSNTRIMSTLTAMNRRNRSAVRA